MAHGLKKVIINDLNYLNHYWLNDDEVGIECTVFKADTSPTARPRNWNFGIYWVQPPLSDCLPDDLVKRLE